MVVAIIFCLSLMIILEEFGSLSLKIKVTLLENLRNGILRYKLKWKPRLNV